MEITFASRSKFLAGCEDAIRSGRDRLDLGETIHVVFEEGGYPGRAVVTIRENDGSYFGTDWEGADTSRFPARIKAAATALLNCGMQGRFLVAHDDGSLDIARA